MLEPIRTERLTLRCWRPDDAPQLKDAIDASLPELQTWVPWAMAHPLPVTDIAATLAGMQERFASGVDWPFGIFDREQNRVLGGSGLHPRRGSDGLAIGYWIRSDATGQGLAGEAAAALTAAAFAHTPATHVEIHCDADNLRSAAIPRRLGFHVSRTFRQRIVTARAAQRDTVVWTLPRASQTTPTRRSSDG